MISRQLSFAAPITNLNLNIKLCIQVICSSLADIDTLAAKAATENNDKTFVTLLLLGECLIVKNSLLKELDYFDARFSSANLYFWGDFCIQAAKQKSIPAIIGDVPVYDLNIYTKSDKPEFKDDAQAFAAKWGFNIPYSTSARIDLISLLDFTVPNIAILEAGCACGATLLDIKNHRPDAILRGVEINKYSAAIANSICPVIAANIETEELPQNMKFDYILCGDVIEHLIDPLAALKKLKPLLKPNGTILVSLPNVMHIPILRDLLAGNWTYQDQGVLDRTHLRFFTLREMVKLFQNAGFNYVGYAPINLICSAEDEEFIKALQALPNVEKDDIQFKAQQFIIKAR